MENPTLVPPYYSVDELQVVGSNQGFLIGFAVPRTAAGEIGLYADATYLMFIIKDSVLCPNPITVISH